MKIYTILSNLSFIDSNLLKIKEMKEIKEIRNQNSVRKKYVYRSYYIRFRTSNLAKNLLLVKMKNFLV